MPEHASFEYAILRVVPCVERQEFVNVGLILYCKRLRYLAVKIDFDLRRLQMFAPTLDVEMVRAHLKAIKAISKGGHEAGIFREWSLSERFHWLVAPNSTMIQTSPVHCGISKQPQERLNELYELFVG